MNTLSYEYTEGHAEVAPGITTGRDVVFLDDDGNMVGGSCVIRTGGRFMEIQSGGDVGARPSVIPMVNTDGTPVVLLDDPDRAAKLVLHDDKAASINASA